MPSPVIANMKQRDASCCFLLLPAASCCFLLLPAASCCFLLLPAASCCFLMLPAASCCFLRQQLAVAYCLLQQLAVAYRLPLLAASDAANAPHCCDACIGFFELFLSSPWSPSNLGNKHGR
jgi:hypothetical protein